MKGFLASCERRNGHLLRLRLTSIVTREACEISRTKSPVGGAGVPGNN